MLRADYIEVVGRALSEDLGSEGDITSDSCVPKTAESKGVFVARMPGVIAGIEVAGIRVRGARSIGAIRAQRRGWASCRRE